MNINEVIKLSEYNFLRKNEHLGNNLLFVVFGGSHAYGTNVETSDIDIRGIATNSIDELLGIKEWEQYTDEYTDSTIYGFNKMIKLLINVNPNVIEMLGCKPEHYTLLSPAGKLLLDKKNLFLSQKAVYSFREYSNAQRRRLENAIAIDNVPQSIKEEHIKNSLSVVLRNFSDRYTKFGNNSILLSTMKTENEDYEQEIVLDISMQKYSIREFSKILNEMNSIVKTYDKLSNRKNKKDALHLNKHAMHHMRSYIMCLDILEKGEINTYIEKEHDILMATRDGYFANSDGTYKQEFFDIVDSYKQKVFVAAQKTKLPENPDYEKINDLTKTINRMSLYGIN